MSAWRWLVWKDGNYLSRAVPESLVADTIAHTDNEALLPDAPPAVLEKNEPCPSLFLDLPGMVKMDRPRETFDLDGLMLVIPSEDVGAYSRAVRKGPSIDGLLYLNGFHRCLVLSEAHRAQLGRLLLEREGEAESRAEAFYAVNKTPDEALREATAKVLGVPTGAVPNLGNHKLDRFRRSVA